MGVYDRNLEAAILRQRGQNRLLAKEVIEKVSEEGKERLFRIFQEMENEIQSFKRKVRTPWVR